MDSPDHKSHMAYPDQVNNGKCPASHPVRMMSLFYEILYEVNDWKNMWYGTKPPFVLSNGDPTGYGKISTPSISRAGFSNLSIRASW